MIRILQSHRLLTVSGVTERTMFILRVSVLVFLSVSGVFAAGGIQQQGSYLQQQATNVQALESVPASEVEYVEGPLAPLYDFLIQRRLQKFCKLLRDAGLEEVLQSLGGYWTLFVPTDASFLYLPGGTLENLKSNPQQLRDFILYHFVTGNFPSSQILNEMLVDSVQGAPLRFNVYGQIVTVSGAQILEPDLEFELGRVHIIDHPLYPIPTTDTVSYLRTSHQRFYRLLLDAGLIDYLTGGTFTILAPNDDAFDFLSVELKDALSANSSLAERVLYNHILPGSIYTGGIVDGMRWDTVGGSVIIFTTKRGLIFANGIPIVLPDVPFTNGVIHVTNRVLLPEGVEADCQCKPSTSPQQPSPQVSPQARPPFSQTQRPQSPQSPTTRRPNDQYLPRQTPSPFGGPPPAAINPNVGQPISPRLPAQEPQRPFSPTRTGVTPRPIPPPVQIARTPADRPLIQPPSEDNSNTVLGPEFQPPGGQRKPEPSRTTRYPPLPDRRPPVPQPQRGQQPQSISDNDVGYPNLDVGPIVTNPPRQTSRWVNRQPTQAPRYPSVPQNQVRTQRTTRRPQPTRSYDRVTPQIVGRVPDQNGQSGQTFATQSVPQDFQTQKPPVGTTSWQQRKQVTQKPPVPSRPNSQPRVPPPPQRRPTQPRPVPATFPSTAPLLPQVTDQPFESNRDCRRRSDRVTPSTQNLPLCPETGSQDCQSGPYNPSDPRPSCTVPSDCRRPNEAFNPSDNRPLCASPAPGQGCRSPGERPYAGDRRPLCTPSPPAQTNCRDPSAPYSRSDNRPLCTTSSSINNVTPPQETPQTGCRRQDEPSNPQDRRPLCPVNAQEDCRPFLERPKPGDRRPLCNINRQPIQINPGSHVNKGQGPPSQQRPTQSQNNRGRNTQTTRRQSWQQTTRAPQRTTASVTNPNNQIGKVPPVSGGQRPTSPPFQPQRGSFQTGPQISPRQPQPGAIQQPQTGTYPSRPQSGIYPSQPETDLNVVQPQSPGIDSPQPQTGPNRVQPEINQPQSPSPRPSQPQSPGSRQPSPNTRPSQPQSPGSRQPSPSPRPSQPQSPGSRQPPQNTRQSQPQSPGSQQRSPPPNRSSPRPYPPIPQPVSRPTFVPQAPPPAPGTQSQGPYPQQGVSQPPSSFQPIQTPFPPVNQPNQPIDSIGGPGSNQPFTPQRRPVNPPRQPTGLVTSYPGRGTVAPRVPVSVSGTSTTPSEDSRRTLYEIVEDPALLIRGTPVKLTRVFNLFLKAGLEDILSGPGPTTVFLPADDAFAMLPKGVVDQLEENPELLRRVLLYHVTNIEILPNPQGESYTVPSLEGTQIPITMLNGGRLILISGAKAIAVTRANNGIFYVINQLLYPLPHENIVGAIQSRPDLSTLSWLLSLSGLAEMLQGQTPYTLLAPTDNAFAQLPPAALEELTQNTTALQELLLNHIVEGAHYGREFLTGGTFPNARGGKLKFQVVSYGYQVNEVNIKTPEIVTGTGVIHLIDEVLLEAPDKRFINSFDNSVTGPDVTPADNSQTPANDFQAGQISGRQPSSNGQRLGTGQQPALGGPISRRGPSPGQPQITGLQPQLVGQRTPQGGQRAPATQRPTNNNNNNRQPQNAVTAAFGGQRQNVPQTQTTFGQPSLGTRRPAVPGQQTFSGQRQPSFQPGSLTGNGQQGNVADLARSMGLNRFANWLTNTGLLEKIHDGGVYTVFAPTDDAVNSLPQDMVYSIDSNPEQTKPLLQYHIIPRTLNLNSITNEETSSTLLQGKNIRFNVYETVEPNCKQLVTASGTPIGDALATMGSIQVIPVTQVLYQPTGNMLNIIDASPILQSLSQAIKSARITWVLSGNGPLTFFAPSDTAFQSLSPEQKRTMIDDKQAFAELLKRHLVRGTFFSSGVQEDLQKNSEANTPLTISLQEGILTVNSVPVTYSDITATNGVLHVIDQFL